jgi:predicted nucleic acid-binding protein
MDHLVDTNVLLRSVQQSSATYREACGAIAALLRRGDRLCIFPQNITEFWSVATRPGDRNGLGLSPTEVDRCVFRLEAILTLIPDAPNIYQEWRNLVVAHAITGAQVYDARLVAAMTVHAIPSILTFNVDDFKRYPGIQVIHPRSVAASEN